MEIKIIKEPIKKSEIITMAHRDFGDTVKAVVDIEQCIMAIGGELHADEETLLVEREGSKREHIWGINIHPERSDEEFIEFDSMINLKPTFGNRSRGIENTEIQKQIKEILDKLILS